MFSPVLRSFIAQEVLPGLPFTIEQVEAALDKLVVDLSDRQAELLGKRDQLQKEIDSFFQSRSSSSPPPTEEEMEQFLRKIGYITAAPQWEKGEEGAKFHCTTKNVDDAMAKVCGPQLVVPCTNARYVLNAANARWGSLYNVLYGTDALGSPAPPASAPFDDSRRDLVVKRAKEFLDSVAPLSTAGASHVNAVGYSISEDGKQLLVKLADGSVATISSDRTQLIGYSGPNREDPDAILLQHHGLHVEITRDRRSKLGQTDPSGVSDVFLESAVTTIVDLEDSVACVDAEDKIVAYRNWLGLMKGDLVAEFEKNGGVVHRTLNPDRVYNTISGTITVPGRSLLLIRHVGHHIKTDAATHPKTGEPIFEGILDALVTSLIAMHDLRKPSSEGIRNSHAGSVYVVKPKMHGPEEVQHTINTLAAVESALGLAPTTLKLGIMDEERRTSVNLEACLELAKDRAVFINTGFLDRTGDEIHTSMYAGPALRKADIRLVPWLQCYEKRNVAVGLQSSLHHCGQIGKGMFTKPDMLAALYATKRTDLMAGATTAWVPSPSAAVVHALHYHEVDVTHRQKELLAEGIIPPVKNMLIPPVAWTEEKRCQPKEVEAELRNNVQGILGYVVRFVESGVGCSKVPDIDNVGLMEDRATLRISSQHIANWLLHKIVSMEQVDAVLREMAAVVDQQNQSDKSYRPMSPNFDDSIAFQAARQLIVKGVEEPNGYTENVLHSYRLAAKKKYGH